MTKQKNTKRALLASVLSMMLCMAMLVGSTFAWFTDSVTSGKNKIVAGNLDVELEYSTNGSDWATVTADTNLFKPTNGEAATLWEPGHTEYVYLRVRNAGSLALKYRFAVNVFGDEAGGAEKKYTNVEGKEFKLSEHLVFTKAEGTAAVTDRESLWMKDAVQEKEAMGDLSGLGMEGTLLLGENKAITLAVYMPTQVGNEANQSTAKKDAEGAPTIFLGLTLSATQIPHESDSFDKDYDKDAEYDGEVSTEASLVAAIEKGGSYKLAKDINLTQPVNVANGTTVVLNLNGKTLSYDSDYAINNKGDLTIGGDGDIKGRGGIKSTAGKLTINGGTYTASSDYTQSSYQHALKAENTEVVINGGTFGNDSAKPNAVINVAGGSNVTINGGTFKNVTGDLSRFDPYLFTYEKNGKLIINDGTFYGGWRFNGNATTDIYGGNFTPVTGVSSSLANKLQDIVAEGYSIVDNADGTKTVLPVVP